MLKKILTLIIFVASSNCIFAQNPIGYKTMLTATYKNTVKLVQPVELDYIISTKQNITILDTREAEECAVGKIKNARCVGYNNFKVKQVADISKEETIYVYCSIGYRSERVGEMLQQNGYKRVFNLYGGIFNWANSGYPLVNKKEEPTNAVHGYNKDWSKWLNKEKCIIELD